MTWAPPLEFAWPGSRRLQDAAMWSVLDGAKQEFRREKPRSQAWSVGPTSRSPAATESRETAELQLVRIVVGRRKKLCPWCSSTYSQSRTSLDDPHSPTWPRPRPRPMTAAVAVTWRWRCHWQCCRVGFVHIPALESISSFFRSFPSPGPFSTRSNLCFCPSLSLLHRVLKYFRPASAASSASRSTGDRYCAGPASDSHSHLPT
jgi:hypothetical protein